MAQVAIREFDAKSMFFESIGKKYSGLQIKSEKDLEKLQEGKKYVIKPDMLFGKRGKLGLLGVGLEKDEIKKWFQEQSGRQMEISGVSGTLEVFLAEEFVEHKEEYYISFEAKRDFEEINFSFEGGVEVEENWEKVKNLQVEVDKNLEESDLENLLKNCHPELVSGSGNENFERDSGSESGMTEKGESEIQKIKSTILQLWSFYKNYGFVYLEVNPFCFDKNGEVVLLDMVAKIDDQEGFLQKNHWKDLEIPNTFGFKENKREAYIRELDSQTGASLKFKVLNPKAKIWTLLAGGGGSLVMTDSLGALGFAKEIGNYGELSGNPTRDFTREYTRTLFEQMLENGIKGKYLIIAGAIANFTNISTTFSGIIDVLKEKKKEILEQKIQILVRRGGINEKQGLEKIKKACEELKIPCKIADSSQYMTDILREIRV
ncbi:hypothetical protein CSB09_04570 [Candidatus Gracilibacteria bacterium]|nr:MAG: hypothetical protein CSB09_04570 [Candidatus Gracilibacteria bacterium]